MAEEPDLAQQSGKRIKAAPTVRHYGTSKSYIVSRLRREGLVHLVAAVESGRLSAFSIAVRLGWAARRPTLGTGSPNAAKRRQHQFSTLLREGRPK
jgi:hypothetical protein